MLHDACIARIDERIEVVPPAIDSPSPFRPDLLVTGFQEAEASQSPASSQSPVTTVEPVTLEILDRDPGELRITGVKIRSLPQMELITAVGVLSPINVSWQGRQAYLDKRDKLHEARVNLVEIDLLLGGSPLPMKQRLASGA